MKLRKLLSLLSLSFILCSCGYKDPYGSYVFRMGKEQEAHVGASIVLKNEDVTGTRIPEGAKKLVFEVSFQQETGEESQELAIDGYFTIGKELDSGKYQLNVGVLVFGTLPLPEKIVDKCMYCTITNNEVVDLKVPVSGTDLQHQLIWYGYFFNLDLENPSVWELDAEDHHDVGTWDQIKDEDIAYINTKYGYESSRSEKFPEGFEFRAPHVLTLGLTRDE